MRPAKSHKKALKIPAFLVGGIAGLYPLIFLYSKNLTLISTWEHLLVFSTVALVIPGCVSWVLYKIFSKKNFVGVLLLVFNLFVFLALLTTALHAGAQAKFIGLSLLVALVLGYLLRRFSVKIIMLELILSVIALVALVPKLYEFASQTHNWMDQPDAIEEATFTKTPNIYVIQPDGYVNPSQLERGYYEMDTSEMNAFLTTHNFEIYENFRSNYDATLSSNSSLFAMKHHYYQGDAANFELYNAREHIVSSNPVLSVLKNNNYTTHFITESPYLLLTRPALGYDYCNYSYAEIPYLSKGFKLKKEVKPALYEFMEQPGKAPKFFFVQILNPKHIDGGTKGENLAEKKRKIYQKNLNETNLLLQDIITHIQENDKNALVVLVADHGGYVGFESLFQGSVYTEDPDKTISIFSSLLAISWPEGTTVMYRDSLKTNVNLFRVLFAHLAEKPEFLTNLQEDASFLKISSGAPEGVYKAIDSKGNIVFNKL